MGHIWQTAAKGSEGGPAETGEAASKAAGPSDPVMSPTAAEGAAQVTAAQMQMKRSSFCSAQSVSLWRNTLR